MKLTDEQLLNIIREDNISDIVSLEQKEIASSSTIRRKLKKLQADGFISLDYGGKIHLVEQSNISINDKYKSNKFITEKEEIACKASTYINDGDVIFIDNGTTVRHLFKYLKHKDIKIYTNGYNHIPECQKYDLDITIIPGTIMYKEASINGEDAIIFLSYLHIDKCFIGANGYDDKVVTTPNHQEAKLKSFVLKKSKRAFLLVDSSKYNVYMKYVIANTQDLTIISNQKKMTN